MGKKSKKKTKNNNSRLPAGANAPEPDADPAEPAAEKAVDFGENGADIPVCKAPRVQISDLRASVPVFRPRHFEILFLSCH